jgi:hypothetical protein
MSSVLPTTHPVHLGVWTNWSQGPVFGYTLTLNRDTGNLLIAFLAFFVAFTGTRFWRILCQVIHCFRSSQTAKDGLHHQRQVILRNSTTPSEGLWSIALIIWAWRSVKPPMQLLASTVPIAAVAATCALGFLAASGFSSQLSVATVNEVLLQGSRCGYIRPNLTSDSVRITNPQTSKMWASAANYAEDCYKQSNTGFLNCGVLVAGNLPFTIVSNASCPFAAKLCHTNNSSLWLDTGYLDSNDHFGLNAPPSKRFQWRRVIHCSPLVTDGYRSFVQVGNSTVARYYYGQSPLNKGNFTYEYNVRNPNRNFNFATEYTIR